jgi:hypothetical protein
MAGDFSNFTPTYPTTDPDCWWTYHQCVTPKVGNLSADVASVPEVRSFSRAFALSGSWHLFPGAPLLFFVNFIRSLANPRSHPQPRTLGYGFDDGPNCSHNAFYDYLNERGQKASECFSVLVHFFCSFPFTFPFRAFSSPSSPPLRSFDIHQLLNISLTPFPPSFFPFRL